MVQKTTYGMKFHRRRSGKTDYKKRIALLKSRQDRLVVRVLSRQVIAQVVSFDPVGDMVKVTATSHELKKYGWDGHCGNVCAAYLTGFLIGNKARSKGIKACVFDIGLQTPVRGSNVFGALKGALDGGLELPHSEDCFPGEERVSGRLIAGYGKKDAADKFKATKEKIAKEFGRND